MPEEAATSPENPRVLIVEDEGVVALDLARRLSQLGYAVCGPTDRGEDALRLARDLSPDIVLMDIVLDGALDGVDAAGRIRDELAVPVVFLTAHADPETLRRAGAAGPYGYITKPFENRDLTTTLDIALYKSRMERRLRDNEQWTAMTLHYLGEGVITADPQGLVRFANPMAETLLGVSAARLLGRDLATLYKTLRDPEQGDIPDGLEGAREVAILCREDGSRLPVEQTLSSILDDRGRALGTVLVFRDISRRRDVERALRDSVAGLRLALTETVNALTVTSETRDPFTAGHQERVSRLAEALAKALGFSDEEREGVRMAGLVHDIGKIHVPSEILTKPEALSAMEMGIVRDHSTVGFDILKDVPFPWPLARMVLEHHERCDGSGYPAGLRREDMHPGSRILAVADVVEAMTAHRPYRSAWSLEHALAELAKGRGRLYDADVVDACLSLFERGDFRF
ncbi:putative PAS/PAC sensor protein [Solidesulfovibrio fructosivorans JJ]]|uniref:Putative PAS/PAC sensor protein n=1 Tax=Solidesulfovibrio fructosivorans JJ] TaxID=596151 RepID=E1JYT0_SOLFR|nr:HD domain-containing phosphohydrolase [Solidesulfovibrio fructosivorans]EFL50500.1 putative PAS/PAC sensor protein [Solidesulfovibrio fructosivorans JJ]]